MRANYTPLFLVLALLLPTVKPACQESLWLKIDRGLYVGSFDSPKKSVTGDSKITVIKIDPKLYQLRLLTASEMNHPNFTVKDWSDKYELIAAINAGMYLTDYKTNVGYMKNYDHVNNGRINSKYHSVAAFNPVDSTQPAFHIYDTDEADMKQIIKRHNTVIQNLRLIKRPGQNRWPQQGKKWSEAALGQDADGNVLFIFSKSPYSMYDLNNILLQLPINLTCAQHLEGGPEASLYFSHKGTKLELAGSFETGFSENPVNNNFLPIPNIIGVAKK